jgi:carbon monoxide dehydrogenase subunit G
MHIERSADDVWALVGEFGDLSYMPGVDSVSLDGDIRTVNTMGMEIQEQLVAKHDADRSITYSIVGGPVPIEAHSATITAHPDGAGTRLVWEVTVTPDDALGLFVPIYEGSLKAIKDHLEA